MRSYFPVLCIRVVLQGVQVGLVRSLERRTSKSHVYFLFCGIASCEVTILTANDPSAELRYGHSETAPNSFTEGLTNSQVVRVIVIATLAIPAHASNLTPDTMQPRANPWERSGKTVEMSPASSVVQV